MRWSNCYRDKRAVAVAFGIALLVVVPFVFTPYRVGELTIVIAYAIALVGLTVLVGNSGQVSLAHASFFAVGAYTSAILMTQTDLPFLLTIPVSSVLAMVVGLSIGFPAMRLSGLYLAMATMVLAVATPQVIKRWGSLTNGSDGILVPRLDAPSWTSLAPDQYLYLIAVIIFLVIAVIARSIVTSHIGRSMVALRDNPTAAASFGVSGLKIKPRAFAFSAFCAGVGGAVFGVSVGFVSPDTFGMALALNFLAAATIGGLGSVVGALGGALFLMYVPQIATEIDKGLTGVIYGVVMILFVFFVPGGLASISRIKVHASRLKRADTYRFTTKNGSTS